MSVTFSHQRDVAVFLDAVHFNGYFHGFEYLIPVYNCQVALK